MSEVDDLGPGAPATHGALRRGPLRRLRRGPLSTPRASTTVWRMIDHDEDVTASGDAMLASIIQFVDAHKLAPLQVILNVQGMVVGGKIIAYDKYITKALPNIRPEVKDLMVKTYLEIYEGRSANDDAPHYIHLDDVYILSENPPSIRRCMRVRLSEVSAFSLVDP